MYAHMLSIGRFLSLVFYGDLLDGTCICYFDERRWSFAGELDVCPLTPTAEYVAPPFHHLYYRAVLVHSIILIG